MNTIPTSLLLSLLLLLCSSQQDYSSKEHQLKKILNSYNIQSKTICISNSKTPIAKDAVQPVNQMLVRMVDLNSQFTEVMEARKEDSTLSIVTKMQCKLKEAKFTSLYKSLSSCLVVVLNCADGLNLELEERVAKIKNQVQDEDKPTQAPLSQIAAIAASSIVASDAVLARIEEKRQDKGKDPLTKETNATNIAVRDTTKDQDQNNNPVNSSISSNSPVKNSISSNVNNDSSVNNVPVVNKILSIQTPVRNRTIVPMESYFGSFGVVTNSNQKTNIQYDNGIILFFGMTLLGILL